MKSSGAKGVAGRKSTPQGKPRRRKRSEAYHHGALRDALLEAAESILVRQGIQGLTLRASAREAGVSHAAPKNHFRDLSGLLSDLAALGFDRLSASMLAQTNDGQKPSERMRAIGRGYVDFARTNPALFLLMFRSERLDFSRPALIEASKVAFSVLTNSFDEQGDESPQTELSISLAAQIAASWSQVHGLAMLLIDGRLRSFFAKLPHGTGEDHLLDEMFGGAKTRT
jgi:AcrR family transcriptional regulator